MDPSGELVFLHNSSPFELREEVARVSSLEAKVKKAKDKYSVKEKEWEVKEKSFQDKVALLEAKAQEQEESHTTEAAKLREALATKTREVETLKGEAAKHYMEGFDEAIGQVKFLYANLDVSSCSYFKEI